MPRASARPIAGTRSTRVHASDSAATVTAQLFSESPIATLPQTHPARRRAEHRQFGLAAQRMINAGQRPCVRVVVFGFDGILVQMVIEGVPGAFAHARTRRRAREIARASVASIFDLDPLDFDLEVVGA